MGPSLVTFLNCLPFNTLIVGGELFDDNIQGRLLLNPAAAARDTGVAARCVGPAHRLGEAGLHGAVVASCGLGLHEGVADAGGNLLAGHSALLSIREVALDASSQAARVQVSSRVVHIRLHLQALFNLLLSHDELEVLDVNRVTATASDVSLNGEVVARIGLRDDIPVVLDEKLSVNIAMRR